MGERLLFMRGLCVVLLVLVACGFVVGSTFSEIETSFVIVEQGVSGLGFWGMYGDYLVAGVIMLVVVVIYLNAIKSSGKKRRK